MKETPPSFANAAAKSLPETDCITALTKGIFIVSSGCSPFLNFTNGVSRSTLSGVQSLEEYPGTKRYSLKVLEGVL